jgi:hypothetical protein
MYLHLHFKVSSILYLFDSASPCYCTSRTSRKAVVTLPMFFPILKAVLMPSDSILYKSGVLPLGSRFLNIFSFIKFLFLPGVNRYIITHSFGRK